MIKIIKEGKLPEKTKVVFNIKCAMCNCEFEFEQEDFTKIEKHPDGNYFIKCPCCGCEIRGKYDTFNPQIIKVYSEGE